MKDYFEEIIGYEDIKNELRIISDMLNNTEVYQKLGAGIKEGLILSGAPGTGKTTMANCLIKSTNRTVFTIRKKSSDGDFINTIEKTFEEAKQKAPSIILLDDLDKFSDKSDDNVDAEEFVTIQSCIDEIRGHDVFVLATVNVIHKIPDSLLRSGRLGKRIRIFKPDIDEATEIVKYYLKKSNMPDNLDSASIARMLNGESCAALENIINSAAMKAAYKRQESVKMDNIIDSCLDMLYEAPEGDMYISEDIKRKIAYHEAGHAFVAELLDPGSVSLISLRKTRIGECGFVRYSRTKDKYSTSAEYKEVTIKAALAGRAATELVYGETDMGANSDLHDAFDQAIDLVDDVCMYGFQNWISDKNTEVSAANRNRYVAMLMEKNYLEVKKLIAQNRKLLDLLVEELMKKTTLVYSDVQAIMGNNIDA